MVDNFNDFWGRLGAALDMPRPDIASRDPVALGASPASIDASVALSRALAQYTAVAAQGIALQQIAALKVQIPCVVWTAYASARQDYLLKAQEIFDQLKAKSITIEQVLYSAQGPKLDPSNPTHAATARLLAPLRPPAFTGLNQQCPGVVDMAGAQFVGFADLGWERIPIQLASVPLASLATLGKIVETPNIFVLFNDATALVGVASPSGFQTLKDVAVLPRAFSTDLQSVTAYTNCFRTHGSNAEAGQRCSPNPSRAVKPWKLLGIGALVLIVGGLIMRALRKPTLADAEPDEVYSRSSDPILVGDLYWHPRTRARRRLKGI